MYFKLKPKVGSHSETDAEGTVQTYKSEDGHIFDTERDLCEMFPNKFERVEVMTAEQLAAAPKVKMGAGPATTDTTPATPDKTESKFGRDVSEKFPTAGVDDLKVFQDGGAFTVVEADAPEKRLHDKPLKSDKVEAFIKKYLSE